MSLSLTVEQSNSLSLAFKFRWSFFGMTYINILNAPLTVHRDTYRSWETYIYNECTPPEIKTTGVAVSFFHKISAQKPTAARPRDPSASAGSEFSLTDFEFNLSAGGKARVSGETTGGGGPAVPRSGGARDHPGSSAHSFPGLAGKSWGEPETRVSQ